MIAQYTHYSQLILVLLTHPFQEPGLEETQAKNLTSIKNLVSGEVLEMYKLPNDDHLENTKSWPQDFKLQSIDFKFISLWLGFDFYVRSWTQPAPAHLKETIPISALRSPQSLGIAWSNLSDWSLSKLQKHERSENGLTQVYYCLHTIQLAGMLLNINLKTVGAPLEASWCLLREGCGWRQTGHCQRDIWQRSQGH